jgi:tetratricopeptide (TPR) repeat protein
MGSGGDGVGAEGGALEEGGGEEEERRQRQERQDLQQQQPEWMFLPQMPAIDGGDHGRMLCGLATLLHRLGRFDDAKGLYHEALSAQIHSQIRRDHPEKFTSIPQYTAAAVNARNDPMVGTILSRQAHLYREMGLPEQALDIAKEACKIKKHMLGCMHDEYAVSLSALGAIYLQQHAIFQVPPALTPACAPLPRPPAARAFFTLLSGHLHSSIIHNG